MILASIAYLVVGALCCRIAYLSGVRKGHLEMEEQNSRTWNAGFDQAKDFYAPDKPLV